MIGNGNVAMDVARMLALTDHELRQTDTADHAIELLDAKRDPRDRRPRPPRAGPGRLHQPGDQGARRDGGRRRDRRPVRGRARPASEAYLASEEADKTTRVNVETLREFSQRTPEGKRQRIVLRFLASPVEIKGEGKVEKIVIGRNELVEEGGTLRAKDTRRARGARVRAGPALGRLHRRADRGRALRREARPDPQRRRPRARLARLRPQGRPLHRRLDQARPLGRDRHQQERRPGDRPAPARRRRRRRPCSTPSGPSRRRSRSCSPSAASASSASRTGRRSTRPRSAAASRTAARGSSSSASRRCSARSARKVG